MQSKFTSTVFAFVCGALVVAIAFGVGLSVASMQSASAAEPTQAVQEWEYLKAEPTILGINVNDYSYMLSGYETMSDYVNDLGRQGWELVNVAYYETSTGYSGTVHEAYYFKRPLQPGSAPFTPPTPSRQSGDPAVG